MLFPQLCETRLFTERTLLGFQCPRVKQPAIISGHLLLHMQDQVCIYFSSYPLADEGNMPTVHAYILRQPSFTLFPQSAIKCNLFHSRMKPPISSPEIASASFFSPDLLQKKNALFPTQFETVIPPAKEFYRKVPELTFRLCCQLSTQRIYGGKKFTVSKVH